MNLYNPRFILIIFFFTLFHDKFNFINICPQVLNHINILNQHSQEINIFLYKTGNKVLTGFRELYLLEKFSNFFDKFTLY